MRCPFNVRAKCLSFTELCMNVSKFEATSIPPFLFSLFGNNSMARKCDLGVTLAALNNYCILKFSIVTDHDKSVPVTMLSRSLSPRHGASSGCGWRNGLWIWRVAANTLNKHSRTADKRWPSSLGVGRGANNSSP
jgi:hypothetical protein